MAPRPVWRAKLVRSAYLMGAILLHLVLLLIFSDWIVFHAPPPPVDSGFTGSVKLPPPANPAPPPPSGGASANDLAPSVQTAPLPMQITAISTVNANTFFVSADKVPLPSIPNVSVLPAQGAEIAGHEAAGPSSGSGSPFGSSSESGGGSAMFQGYLYDLKQTRDGQPAQMDAGLYGDIVTKFLKSNWDRAVLDKYYKSDQPLNANSIFIPILDADQGPKAFGVADKVQPNLYLVWYKVSASPPQDGTYHFVGIGDDVLEVRVDGRTVLDGSSRGFDPELRAKQKSYPQSNFDPTYDLNGVLWEGTPFHASAGQPVDIEVLIGEQPGGKSDYFLYIDREESTHTCQSNGSPLYPVFQLDSAPIHPKSAPRSYPPFASSSDAWTGQASGH